jgi:chromosome segregation ATPase
MKDLIFTGDLFNSMTILSTAEKEVAYGFNNARTAQIAEYQETSNIQVNEPIFDLSEAEKNKAERQFAIDVSKIFTGALENFPNMPSANVLKSDEDAISKAQRRNRQKQQKRKAYARKEKQKEAIKAGKVPRKQYTKVEARERAISKAQAKKSALNTKATSILQQRDRAKAELKKNEFARKNLALQTKKAKKYLKVREERLAKVQSQLAKTRSGSKNRQVLTKRLEKAQFEIKTAKSKLENIQRVKTAKKTITKSKTPIAKVRSDYSKAIQQIRAKNTGLREMKRKERAKKLRQGTYKPKPRKK